MLQKGFTLIELMIVVAIIGILSMFALPAYQDYTKRTYVAEGLGLASAAKMAVTEYYSSQAEWPKGNTIAGLPDADTIQAGKNGDVVQAITVADTDGLITIKYGTKVVKDGTLTLSPKANAGSVTWECSEHSKNLETKWLPSNCRHTAKEKA